LLRRGYMFGTDKPGRVGGLCWTLSARSCLDC
jgi:hypothetical protein